MYKSKIMGHIRLTKLLICLFLLSHVATSSSIKERRPYIIHMDKSALPSSHSTYHEWYTSILSSLSATDGIFPTHLYTYSHVLHGFSALLSPMQLEQLERMPGHIATYPESYAKLHTTYTPKFLGLKRHAGLWPASRFGDDMIIGIIDTGVWPESESFRDDGMPPVPERWRGECETGTEFNSSHCNRKLIGARSFSKGLKEGGINISTTHDYDSPRDFFGHGTHTASTAAGSRVPGASYFGYAEGTAFGIAPMARVAMYKVLFYTDTWESAASDVLAGMDQAIADGVDLMSLSLGFPQTPYFNNVIALGAFAATEKGIFVSCSAGNSGPDNYSIFNGAPWITTVGASSIDRGYGAIATLGNGVETIQGSSYFPESIFISGFPLYYGYGNASKEMCLIGALDAKDVVGKIVFCSFHNFSSQIREVNRTGAKGAIIAVDSADDLWPNYFFMPAIAVSFEDGAKVKKYILASAETSKVDIEFQKTFLGGKPAPQVAEFSSRGPNSISPGILKPDIVAPGVNILASWVPNHPVARVGSDLLSSSYVLESGTSMASPHVVGVAALLRAVHPDWSSAAIRSALMTTAKITDNTHGPIVDQDSGKSATPLDFGAGHINPNKAMDPGLVYNIELQDYIDFICGLNYTTQEIRVITRDPSYTCTNANLDLNYPSFIVILNNTNRTQSAFKRTLTNVVDSPSIYRAVVNAPQGMKVVVEPQVLSFEGKYSKQEFSVTVEIEVVSVGVERGYRGNYGYLSWLEDGGKHVVRSPIVSAFANSNED